MADQLEEHRLQDPAGPAGAEQPAVLDGRSRRRRRRRRRRGAGRARGSWRSCGCARCARAARCRRWSAAPTRSRWRDRPRRPAWPAGRRTLGDRLARRGDIATPAGFCARGCSITAARSIAVERRRQLGDVEALVVDVDADDVARQPFEQVEHRREPGMLDDDPVAEAQDDARHAVEGVEGTVDDRDRLRRERPRRPQLLLEGREHGVVEIARRQRLPADLGDDRAEVGEQVGVGRARREVDGEVPRTLADLAVPARPSRPGRVADERAVAAAGLDRPDVGEAAPGLRDGRRGDAEAARQLATVGRRAPTSSAPGEIMRPIVAAMRRAVRPSSASAPSASVAARRRGRRRSALRRLCEHLVTRMYGNKARIVQARRCHITMPA